MPAYLKYPPPANEWAEGAWAELHTAFGAEAYAGQEGLTRVLVQPKNGKHVQGETGLLEFEHPENALYIFGPDMGHLGEGDERFDHSVYIRQTHYHVTIWSHQAAAIALYDRMLKDGHR